MPKKISVLINNKIKKYSKTIVIPGDKSCSIRALLLASQCIGVSKIKNLLESEDVLNCVSALKTLGVKIIKSKNIYLIYGNGLNSFKIKKKITRIYVGNSGTTGRLLAGLLSTIPAKFYLYGDQSMNKRDMSRIIKPLEKIGAFFYPKGKKKLPLTIEGTTLPLAQNHIEDKGSAQVKTAILLSALSTPGVTTINEKKISRSHSEIFLKEIKANIKIRKLRKGNLITLQGQKNIYSFDYKVNSDPSSAAFLIVLTLLITNSKLIIHNVLCNNTRIGFIKILKKMNAKIKIRNLRLVAGEKVGTIVVHSSKLKSITVSQNIPKLIDELPLLFVCASMAKGVSKFKNVGELKHKEADRLLETKKILVQAGIKCTITKDSMTIYGKSKIENKNKLILVNCKGDHRINLTAAIYALCSGIKTKLNYFESVNTSFPGFISLINKRLGGKIEIV